VRSGQRKLGGGGLWWPLVAPSRRLVQSQRRRQAIGALNLNLSSPGGPSGASSLNCHVALEGLVRLPGAAMAPKIIMQSFNRIHTVLGSPPSLHISYSSRDAHGPTEEARLL
jgi:hypothetical protein